MLPKLALMNLKHNIHDNGLFFVKKKKKNYKVS